MDSSSASKTAALRLDNEASPLPRKQLRDCLSAFLPLAIFQGD